YFDTAREIRCMAFEYSLAEARATRPLPTPTLPLPGKRGRVNRFTRPRLRGRVGRGWWPMAIATALIASMCFAGCSGPLNSGDLSRSNAAAPGVMASESTPNLGAGDFKVGLILPLSASGNAGAAGQAMRNAAEMALAELSGANVQLLVKDDGGTGQ